MKHLLLYNKRIIAGILMNIVPHNISYCTRKLVQYDRLIGTIFTNVHVITLYYYFLLCKMLKL